MKTAIAAYAFCAAAGAFMAYFELHTDDTGVEVMFLLVITFVLGCLRPKHAWQWALIIGLCIPGADVVSGKQSIGRALPLLAVVTAIGLAGAYSGVLLRKLTAAATHPLA